MGKIRLNKDRCKGCYLCITNCPNGLIKIAPEMNVKGIKPAYFSGGKPARRSPGSLRVAGEGGCTGCAMCAIICPDCVITVYK